MCARRSGIVLVIVDNVETCCRNLNECSMFVSLKLIICST